MENNNGKKRRRKRQILTTLYNSSVYRSKCNGIHCNFFLNFSVLFSNTAVVLRPSRPTLNAVTRHWILDHYNFRQMTFGFSSKLPGVITAWMLPRWATTDDGRTKDHREHNACCCCCWCWPFTLTCCAEMPCGQPAHAGRLSQLNLGLLTGVGR